MPRLYKPLSPADPQSPITQSPPTGLGPSGRRLWRQLAPLPWVGASDAVALRSLAQLADLIATLEADIALRGPSYESRGRRYAHPSLSTLLEARKALASGLALFGGTPHSRGRLGVAEPPPPGKLEILAARREARAAAQSRSEGSGSSSA